MTKKQRQEGDVLGIMRDNLGKNNTNRVRSMENLALSRAGEDKETKATVVELCVCRDWGWKCINREVNKGFLFCKEKKAECMAREKEGR